MLDFFLCGSHLSEPPNEKAVAHRGRLHRVLCPVLKFRAEECLEVLYYEKVERIHAH